MEKLDVLSEVLVILHASLNAGKRLTQDYLIAFLYITRHILGVKKKSNIIAVSSNGIEAPDLSVIINMLIKNRLISKDKDGYLYLTEKARYVLNDIISSRRSILLWKLASYLCKFSDQTILELAKYLASRDKQLENISLDVNKGGQSQDTESEKIIIELLSALKELLRKDKAFKMLSKKQTIY